MIYWLMIAGIALAATSLTIHAARQWRGDRYLCDDCCFNQGDLCHKPERPQAMSCCAYKPIAKQLRQRTESQRGNDGERARPAEAPRDEGDGP